MYLVTYITESANRGFYLFKEKPSKEYLNKFFKDRHLEEFVCDYKYIDWEVHEIEFQE